jgi:hypothetical protein
MNVEIIVAVEHGDRQIVMVCDSFMKAVKEKRRLEIESASPNSQHYGMVFYIDSREVQ